jgi:outer membrane protein assembly factor BamB
LSTLHPKSFWFILCCCIWLGPTLFSSGAVQRDQPTAGGVVHALWNAGTSPCLLTKPIIKGTLMFVGSCNGKFYALHKSSGEVAWSYDVRPQGDQGDFLATPLLYKDLIVAGTDSGCRKQRDNYVYGLHQETGEVAWKLKASIASTGLVNVDGLSDTEGTVVFGTRDGRWLAVEVASGKIRWRLETTDTRSDCGARPSVTTDGVNVCFLALDRIIHCVEAKSGRELWKRSPRFAITTTLFMFKDVLYFGTANHQIYGLDPANGRQLSILHTDYTPTGSFVWSYKDKKTNDEYIHGFAVDRKNGSGSILTFGDEFEDVVWSRNSDQPWTSGEPELWRGNLFAGNCHGEIVGYDATDGKPQWKLNVNGCITNFSQNDSTLYVTVKEGVIYACEVPRPGHDATKQ